MLALSQKSNAIYRPIILILQGSAGSDPIDRRPHPVHSERVSVGEHRVAAEQRVALHLGMQSRTDEDEKHRRKGFRSHVVIFLTNIRLFWGSAMKKDSNK